MFELVDKLSSSTGIVRALILHKIKCMRDKSHHVYTYPDFSSSRYMCLYNNFFLDVFYSVSLIKNKDLLLWIKNSYSFMR